MPSAFERRREPERHDFIGEPERDDPAAHRKHVRIVMQPGKACGMEIVAQRRTHAWHFVGGYLLALATASEHDPAIRARLGDRAANRDRNRRVVDGVLAVRAVILDEVAKPVQRDLQVFFEEEACVIRADSDTHDPRLYYTLRSAIQR